MEPNNYDRQTDRRHYDNNSRSYCVIVLKCINLSMFSVAPAAWSAASRRDFDEVLPVLLNAVEEFPCM